MTDLTKLADDLSAKADFLKLRIGFEDVSKMREAARILRAAAGVDVAGLMSLVRAIGTAAYEAGQRDEQGIGADASKEVAAENALESALRIALAPKEGADGWIEIGQGNLPPLGEQVLVWCKYGPHWGPMVDCWDEQHEAPVSFSSATIPIGPGWDSGSDFYDVTHWMPIGSPVAASQSVAAQEQKT